MLPQSTVGDSLYPHLFKSFMFYFTQTKAAEARFGCKCCFIKILTNHSNSRLQKHHLSPERAESRDAFRRWWLRRSQVSSGFTLSAPGKLSRSLAGAWPSMRFVRYYSRSRFGPSSVAGLLCPLLTAAARSRGLTAPSVTISRHAADLPR